MCVIIRVFLAIISTTTKVRLTEVEYNGLFVILCARFNLRAARQEIHNEATNQPSNQPFNQPSNQHTIKREPFLFIHNFYFLMTIQWCWCQVFWGVFVERVSLCENLPSWGDNCYRCSDNLLESNFVCAPFGRALGTTSAIGKSRLDKAPWRYKRDWEIAVT